ncbi:SdpI family protein [Bifidobacterium longum]|uniref:SdpI family protein n=1 Tax=Bifidobacterium longum TaxID=216816 RepID=UPI00298F45E7|nr:SdpI family protein [Bifidobacterium longum]
MLIVEVVVAVVVGVFLVGVYRDAKNGTLPLQNSVGIKTPATMSSEDTWNRIHKQYDPIFLVDACALSSSPLKSSLAGPWRRASITWHRRH